MPFASGAFGQLRYIVETVPGTTPVTGNGVNLRNTGQSLKAAVATVSSAEIASHRMATGQARTDLDVDGGFNFEMQGREYDPFVEAVMGTAYTHYGTLGLGAAFGLTTAALLITAAVAPTGTSAHSLLAVGSWIKVVPPAAATVAQKDYFADAWFKVSSTTTTTVVLDSLTPITGAGLSISAAAGYAISQSATQNGATLTRAFTMEYSMPDIGRFLAFRGLQANMMDIDFQVGAITTGSFGFIGRGHDGMLSATTLPGSPVVSQTLEVMNGVSDIGMLMENGVSVLSAGSFIKSVKFSINNGLRAQKALGVFGSAGIGVGMLEVTGTLEMFVQDSVHYNRWFTGANTSVVIGFADAAGNGYLIEMEKVNFTDGSFTPGGAADDSSLSLPFKAYFNAATSRGLRITRAVAA